MIFPVRLLSLASALVVALSSAPTPTPPLTAADRVGERYSIYLDGATRTFDGNGIPVPQSQNYETLTDRLTGEPRYKQYIRNEDTGEDEQDGSPVIRTLYALYDMQDKLVYDWAEYGYSSPFGDLIIKMDSKAARLWIVMEDNSSLYCALWNVKTGRQVVDRVYRVEKIDDSSLLLKSPIYGVPRGVVDTGGSQPVFRPFPPGYGETQVVKKSGHLLAEKAGSGDADSKIRKGVLMTKDYKVLTEGYGLNGSYVGLRGPYLGYGDDETSGVMSYDGKPLYTTPQGEDYDYFDGELVLLRKLTDSVEREWTRRMVKTDGTELAGGYDRLEPIYKDEYGSDDPAEQFLGTRGETVDLLDRTGKVIATRTIPRLYKNELYNLDGYWSYMVLPENSTGSKEDVDNALCGVLNNKLEVVIAPAAYTTITRLYGDMPDGSYDSLDLFQAYKRTPGGLSRIDLLTTSGNLIAKNLTHVGDAGIDRVGVIKGFSMGLIDYSGNWIGKHSVFNKLEDEKGRMIFW